MLANDGAGAGDRIDTCVGQRRGHEAEVPAGYRDRALHEIGVQAPNRIGLNDIEVLEHIGDRAVAIPALTFGVVDVKRPSRVSSNAVQDAADFLPGGSPLDQRGRGDDSGIDHWVVRLPLFGAQANGVERFARRFDPDPLQNLGPPVVFDGHSIDEWLRNGLDAERLLGISDFVDHAIGGHQAGGEPC